MVLAWLWAEPIGAVDVHAPLENGQETSQIAHGVTVQEYCENFAVTYSRNHAIDYQAHSAGIEKESDILMRISNRFQPQDSRFTSEYTCRFKAGKKEGKVLDISVGFFLTGTLEFAEYTQWKDLQIIPIEFVVDPRNDRRGYGVFKYLEKP